MAAPSIVENASASGSVDTFHSATDPQDHFVDVPEAQNDQGPTSLHVTFPPSMTHNGQHDHVERIPDALGVTDKPLSQSPLSPALDGAQEFLGAVPAPPPYDVIVHDLTISVPPNRWVIPTPIPIVIPSGVQRLLSGQWKKEEVKLQGDDAMEEYRQTTIIRNIDAQAKSGEMLAM